MFLRWSSWQDRRLRLPLPIQRYGQCPHCRHPICRADGLGIHSPVTCRLPPFFRHRKAELAGRQQLPDQSDMQSASPYQPCAKGHFPIFPCPVQTMAERQLRLLLTRNIRPHGRRENQVLPHERDNWPHTAACRSNTAGRCQRSRRTRYDRRPDTQRPQHGFRTCHRYVLSLHRPSANQ